MHGHDFFLRHDRRIPCKNASHRFLFNITFVAHSTVSFYRSSNDFLEITFFEVKEYFSLRVMLRIRNFTCLFQYNNKLKIQCDKLRISAIDVEGHSVTKRT